MPYKCDDPSLIPGIYVQAKGKKQKLSSDLHMCCGSHIHTSYTMIIINIKKNDHFPYSTNNEEKLRAKKEVLSYSTHVILEKEG